MYIPSDKHTMIYMHFCHFKCT